MSNPLAAFRKYQKVMLALAAGGAMLAFGVLPILSDWMGQSRGQGGPAIDGNTVAVSWNGGQIGEAELQGRRVLRSQLMAFQQGVVQRTMQRGAQPRVVVVPNTNSEASVVESVLLAQEAERMGIRIGDEAVLRHLTEHLSNDTIDRNELAAVLRDTTGGRLGQQQLFDGLRTELAAHQVRVLANGAAFDGGVTDTAISPGQSFEYFKRLYRRMEAEVMALPASDFVDQVTQAPTEAEINALYEEYKEVFPSPVTPTPGFKEPLRAAFQWAKADFPTFLEREMERLTDEEIQNYYDENKSSYRKISLPTTDDVGLPDDAEGPLEDPSTEDLISEPENEAADADPESESDSNSNSDSETGVDSDSGGLSEEEAADSVERNKETAADEEEIVAPSEAQEVGEEQEVVIDDGVAADQTADGAPVEDATSEVGEDDDPSDEETGDEDDGPIDDETDEAEYQPLSEVRDGIARTLARPKASEAVTKAVEEVTNELKTYFDDYMYWDTMLEEEKGQQPTLPDLNAIAERLGMVAGEIPLISALEAEEYELGQAFELDFSTGQIRRLPFTMMGFSPALERYNPRNIPASDVDSQFVFWKVDQKEAYTPSLEEIRPAIVKHWKLKKALDLAKTHGEKLAKKVRDESQSLQTTYGDDQEKTITSTGQFTWMTFGSTPTGQGAPRLSFVEGVDFPGQDFMRDVSKLESGELTVTHNYPEKIAYVVYMKAVTANQEDLRTLFLNEGVKQPVLFMARQDNMRAATDWYLAKEKIWGMKWQRPPVAGSRIR